MAERYPTPPTHLETVMNEINETFDSLILQLNNRRQALLDEVRALSEEMTDTEIQRKRQVQDLTGIKASIQDKLKYNEMIESQERILAEVDQQLDRLDMSDENECLSFVKYSKEKLIAEIDVFGSIAKRKGIIPNYSTMKQPIIAVGKLQPWKLDDPFGVAFCEETKQIFIADWTLNYIHQFTENGIFVKRIRPGVIKPRGVAIFKNSMYVTDTTANYIILLKLPECTFVKSVINFSLDILKMTNQYNTRNLTVSNNGDLFIADKYNDRILVMDRNLASKHQLTHTCIAKPLDVKIHDDTLFILCKSSDPAIQVFSMKGAYLYSVIARQQVKKCLYFCMDIIGNIIMSDGNEHNIKVFDKKGALIHVIGNEGHNEGEFHIPRGIVVTSSGKLITVSCNKNSCLQIYQ